LAHGAVLDYIDATLLPAALGIVVVSAVRLRRPPFPPSLPIVFALLAFVLLLLPHIRPPPVLALRGGRPRVPPARPAGREKSRGDQGGGGAAMSLGQLLLVIFTFNLLTFGNGSAVLALLQHRLVDGGVLNLDQFLYAYALGRVTPGQNNLYLASIGYMISGWLGALGAIVAIQLPGYLVLPVLKGYERVRHQRSVQGFIRGLT